MRIINTPLEIAALRHCNSHYSAISLPLISADGNAMYSLWFIIKALKCALLLNHDDTFICLGGFELFLVEFNHILFELYLLEMSLRHLGLDPSNTYSICFLAS